MKMKKMGIVLFTAIALLTVGLIACDTGSSNKPSSTYKVTFDAMGGTPAPKAINVKKNAIMGDTQPTAPAKTGYLLDGWYKEKECINKWSFFTDRVEKNMTLYAKWNPDEANFNFFTVTFNMNYGPVETVKVLEGDKLAKPADPVRDGFDFGGWYTDASATAQYDFNTAVSAALTLYAKWTLKSGVTVYTVTLKYQDDVTPDYSISVKQGTPLTEPQDPAREGYSFDGWYIDSGYATAYDFAANVTGDITLYAKWVAFPVITFDPAGGTLVGENAGNTSIEVEPGTALSGVPAAELAGKVFVGWFKKTGETFDYSFAYADGSIVTESATAVAMYLDQIAVPGTDEDGIYIDPNVWTARWNADNSVTNGSLKFGEAFVYSFDDSINLADYENVEITYFAYDYKDAGSLVFILKDGDAQDLSNWPQATLKKGELATFEYGLAYWDALKADGSKGFGFQGDLAFRVKIMAIKLYNRNLDYGPQEDGSYGLDPRFFVNWWGTSFDSKNAIIDFNAADGNGGQMYTLPEAVQMDNYASMNVEYEILTEGEGPFNILVHYRDGGTDNNTNGINGDGVPFALAGQTSFSVPVAVSAEGKTIADIRKFDIQNNLWSEPPGTINWKIKIVSITLAPPEMEPGDVKVTVEFTAKTDEVIDLSATSTTLTQADTLSATIAGEYTSYEWHVDGVKQDGATTATFELACTNLKMGAHTVSAVVYKDTVPYSKTLNFKVVEGAVE